MRRVLVYFFLIGITNLFAQSDIVTQIKQLASPTDVIIFTDSLLINNSGFDNTVLKDIKYYQALAYQENSNHKKAIELFDEVVPLLDKDSKVYINVLLQQSNSNVYLNHYSLAMKEAVQALEISKEKDYEDMIASANTALSFIHYSNKDYTKAFDYLSSSVELFQKNNDSIQLSATYNNIAIIYKKMGDFINALGYNKQSLAISLAKQDYEGIGKSFSNIGRIYELIGDADKALEYYNKAVVNNKENRILNSIPYRNIGDVYSSLGKLSLSEKSLLKALEIERKNDNQIVIEIVYNTLLKNALKQKDYEKALKYQTERDRIQWINNNNENKEKISLLENEQKLVANRKELLQLKEINYKNRIIFGVLAGFLLVVVLLLLQRNKNRKLQDEKELLRLEQRVLRSQMNPHFIFNALSAIQNSLLDNDPIKSASYLSRFAKLIRQNFDFINQKSILLSEELDALRNYMDTQKMRFQDKFDYEINVFADVDLNSTEIPPLLLQPFVENAIEHGFKNLDKEGKLSININRKESSLCFTIKDNGVGFDEKKKDNKTHALDVFIKRLKLRGKSDEKSFSIQSNKEGTLIKFCLKP